MEGVDLTVELDGKKYEFDEAFQMLREDLDADVEHLRNIRNLVDVYEALCVSKGSTEKQRRTIRLAREAVAHFGG